ncbi:hypothetical protein LG3211_2246 [Lysobacter gummosus]|nr:hypothetical protein LG3211_2246 [Lysobacter gummosus]
MGAPCALRAFPGRRGTAFMPSLLLRRTTRNEGGASAYGDREFAPRRKSLRPAPQQACARLHALAAVAQAQRRRANGQNR